MASDGPGPRNWGSTAISVKGTYQLLDPLPLSLRGELRAQGPYLISPHQDGPDGIEEERERSVAQPPNSLMGSCWPLLQPPGANSAHANPFLVQSPS